MHIYLTHCCAIKNDSIKDTSKVLPPQALYLENYLQNFVQACQAKNATWAIFSDLYGIWFPSVQHAWYDKHPDTVTPSEFKALLFDFDKKLAPYETIYFYYETATWHPFYDRLIEAVGLRDRVVKFSDLGEVF